MKKISKWLTVCSVFGLCLMLSISALAASTILRYGDKGEEVRRMQQALSNLGYANVTVDGKFGAYTENAVRQFQKNNGLKVDGLAGSATLNKLYTLSNGQSSTPTPAPAATPVPGTSSVNYFGGNYNTIRHGDSGDRVKILQRALNQAGFGTIKVDGKFGTGTLNAVMAFQRANGLTTDGKAGKLTLKALETVLSGTVEPPKPTVAPTTAPTTAPVPTISGTTSWVRPTRKLYNGTTGDDVKNLQGRLKELGYYTGKLDGKFGSGTMTAVVAFQRANKLTADGIAGTKTYDKLFATPSSGSSQPVATPAPGSSSSTLKKNMRSMDVLKMQGALALLDYAPNVYGFYDNVTVAAVKDFQSRNGLTADGIAGPMTLQKLYSGTAVRGTATGGSAPGEGAMSAPATSQVKLLHWSNEIKSTLPKGALFLIYDPATGLSFHLRLMSAGRHADVEPYTKEDTAIQYRAFGNRNDWGPKPVYVLLPDGRWTAAVLTNIPHGSQTITNNNYNGQNCLHFLRDMSETIDKDPNWGVDCQKSLREYWKWLTGQTVE